MRGCKNLASPPRANKTTASYTNLLSLGSHWGLTSFSSNIFFNNHFKFSVKNKFMNNVSDSPASAWFSVLFSLRKLGGRLGTFPLMLSVSPGTWGWNRPQNSLCRSKRRKLKPSGFGLHGDLQDVLFCAYEIRLYFNQKSNINVEIFLMLKFWGL